ncbi:MAG: hypothetical protein LC105_06345 [Chitinophagales bacterium]|nr:hypothetical protein [Chitinophagales bacterium]MCZ2393455.1 hypothetical protein [Chitinophagales bacterium]
MSQNTLWGQAEKFNIQRLAFHERIDQQQKYLDILDGTNDSIITFKDSKLTEKASHIYIQLVDSIQEIIEDKNTDGAISYGYLLQVYNILSKISPNNYHFLDYYERMFKNIYSILKHKEDDDFQNYLLRDIVSSINNITFYKENDEAEPFLLKAALLYPSEVLKNLNLYSTETYTLKIIEEVARVSPMTVKKYFNSKNSVNAIISESQDSIVRILIDLYNKYGNESKVYYFIDLIYHNNISSDLLNSVSQYPLTYLNALIQAKQQNSTIGKYDIEQELSIRALEEVRKVNELHDLTDTSKRFANVKAMGASELYTLIVYSPEEIFTSTFNGLFERLLIKMKSEGLNGYYLMEQVNFNKFRTFIKLCAGYNTLETFLSTMPQEQATEILKKFVSELNGDDGNIAEAVYVVDTFGSLENLNYLKTFEIYLKEEFCLPQLSKDSRVLYGLLLKLLYQKMGNNQTDSNFVDLLENYKLPAVDQIAIESFADSLGTTQLHFFFDDEDGLTSFSTFIGSFKNAGYQIQDSTYFVVIKGKGKQATTIYANKPLFEREGQEKLVQKIQNGDIHPSIIVHRGHSYYAMNTISQIPEYAKVVFLGSCGGYHNLSEVIKRAPNAQIIASKQIGTYTVNNALLVEMSKVLKDKNELVWTNLWKDLDNKLKGSGKSYERFLDYVPPHKNLGAIFIQAYNQMIKTESN